IYLGEKSLREAGDKINSELKENINSKIEKLKSVKDSDNIDEIKSAIANLSAELQKIGQMMYNQNQDGHNPQKESNN
ncbi:MAG: Hsp70 family protein, partial [Patescibacteria group bacterium]|nr:Hsp70 family protein [Patescibacteria group bacterium]MDW8280055.1 Hsp70 family protein [bacterium]